MAVARMCMHRFGGYSNVALHFLFTKLFHQINPYLILGGGTIHDGAGGKEERREQNAILMLDYLRGLLSAFMHIIDCLELWQSIICSGYV